MHTESINHGPGVTFMQTGSQIPGRPSFGSWIDYGLGSANANLPSFVVLITKDKVKGQPLMSHLWSAGFLPSKHQGVKFRNQGDAVLYLSNPPGVSSDIRRSTLDRLAVLNGEHFQETQDPEIQMRIAQYELAFRMQSSVPDLLDLASEPQHVLDMYGPDVKRPGSYAANCLLARRLAERDVRFIQLFHMGWDHHGGLPAAIRGQCTDTDQATAALIKDLEQRGMLDDTLIVWGGEFGRTVQSGGGAGLPGRDHNGKAFSVWMAGGNVKGGQRYGETDETGGKSMKDIVHVHDLHATILHLMGFNHEKLIYQYNGRPFRLTDVYGNVIKELIG
jgi:hypothetical protein